MGIGPQERYTVVMNEMSKCLFCKIIDGEIPSQKIYEDDETFAFLDINPVNPGHALVVPKKHSENLYDIEEEDWLEVTKTVKMLAPKIKEAMKADGINIEMNNDKAAGQVIFHTHVHIVPRIDDDGFRHWPGTPYKDGEAEKIAEKITKLMK